MALFSVRDVAYCCNIQMPVKQWDTEKTDSDVEKVADLISILAGLITQSS